MKINFSSIYRQFALSVIVIGLFAAFAIGIVAPTQIIGNILTIIVISILATISFLWVLFKLTIERPILRLSGR